MNSKEHLEEAERWLEEAKRGYSYAPASDTGWMKVRAAVDIARAHAIISVQKDSDE